MLSPSLLLRRLDNVLVRANDETSGLSSELTPCTVEVNFVCGRDCFGDSSTRPVCIDELWQCPEGKIDLSECAPMCDMHLGDECCDEFGGVLGSPDCDGRSPYYFCHDGSFDDCENDEIHGSWPQVAWIPCPGVETDTYPPTMIGELELFRGDFSLTWGADSDNPDFSGSYSYTSFNHTLSMTILSGENLPGTPTLLDGRVRLTDGNMELPGHWFGTLENDPQWGPPNLCGVQLERL
jgi:hypothetical protein